MADVGGTELVSRRVLAVTAACIVVVIALAAPPMTGGGATLPDWYIALVGTVVVLVVAVGVLAPWLNIRMLRVGAGIGAAGYLLAVMGFTAAIPFTVSLERVPWMLSTVGLGSGLALLAGGVPFASFTLVYGAVMGFSYRLLFGGLDLDGIVNDLQSVMTAAVGCLLVARLLDVSRSTDRARATEAEASARAAAERGRLAARSRAAALVHDEVLATLTIAATTGAAASMIPRGAVSHQAAKARTLVEQLDREGASPVGELRARLEALTTAADAELDVALASTVEPTPAAEEALLAAVRQALDNSVRHAGAGATRRVSLRATADGITIEVVDDGCGFDPDAVPRDRLGIATSVLRRVRDVPGGVASVRSAPGQGTVVSVGWAPWRGTPAGSPTRTRPLRGVVIATVAVFVVTQGAAATAAALAGPVWWTPPILLLALLVLGAVLRGAARPVPSARVAGLIALGAVAVAVAGAAVSPYGFGAWWFVAASAFVLAFLALSGRPLIAVIAQSATAVLLLAIVGVRDDDLVTLGYAITRPLLIVAVSVAVSIVIARLLRRRRLLDTQTIADAGMQAWDAAARAELAHGATMLRARVVPVLNRLADDDPLDEHDRSACASLEGQLRDEYRAGVLVRDPLDAAVRAARARGVDVVLLDDGDGSASDVLVDEVARWMAPLVDGARQRVLGRLLPAGRSTIATIVTDDETTLFRGRDDLPA
ncbi:ATP-binding protein [Microbacterium sp. SLBN-146]|uniref:sensor histidine kinase n=1 Tax=Microbacterium sp. SLBN-146 TaxID=2768457 RepID=UPI00114D657E|nr:ATP-binding protein [Microbacterium sp. SLBN-146]TQJ30788.1 signal transduction histidine kinase [Microbacterium sp. SLBN-146]